MRQVLLLLHFIDTEPEAERHLVTGLIFTTGYVGGLESDPWAG